MGKLAERLADYRRSGVYRVESTDAIEEAAALNGFVLERVGADAASFPLEPADGRVLVLQARRGLEDLLASLEAAGERARAQRLRFFAVFVDPAGLLPLPPLYNWTRR